MLLRYPYSFILLWFGFLPFVLLLLGVGEWKVEEEEEERKNFVKRLGGLEHYV